MEKPKTFVAYLDYSEQAIEGRGRLRPAELQGLPYSELVLPANGDCLDAHTACPNFNADDLSCRLGFRRAFFNGEAATEEITKRPAECISYQLVAATNLSNLRNELYKLRGLGNPPIHRVVKSRSF